MEKIVISCLESRMESDRSIYARFLLGPFKDDAVTIATALRRSLLSKVKSIAITAIHIQGVTHEFSTIVGVRESVLDLALHFQQVVLRVKPDAQSKRFAAHTKSKILFRKTEPTHMEVREDERKNSDPTFEQKTVSSETVEIGYLQMQGPAVIYANDLKLPTGIECVDPTQYIATLSGEGSLVVKFLIGGKKVSLDRNAGVLTGEQLFMNTFTKGKSFVGDDNELLTKRLQSKETNSLNKRVHRHVPDYPNSAARTSNILDGSSQLPNDPFKWLDPTTSLRNTIFLDPIFDSVFQANYLIEKDDLFNQPRERIVLEFWTNGSVHPRQALHTASLSLISTFSVFRKPFQLDSL